MSSGNNARPHSDHFQGSRVLVIGGTAGIGKGVASAALVAGARVFLSSSTSSRVAAAAAEFQSAYPNSSVSGVAADLSDPATIETSLEAVLGAAVEKLGGPLDHVAYTAGDAFDFAPLSAVTAANAYSSWTVRYLGPLLLAKLVAVHPDAYLRAAATSSITLTSGIHGTRPFRGLSKSIAWCGAVETLTRALAVDMAPIRINNISPGSIRTPMLDALGEEVIADFAKAQLLKDVGTVQEVAEAYLFCMRCSFATGQQFTVDGGYTYK